MFMIFYNVSVNEDTPSVTLINTLLTFTCIQLEIHFLPGWVNHYKCFKFITFLLNMIVDLIKTLPCKEISTFGRAAIT